MMISFCIQKRLIQNEISGRNLRNSDRKSLNTIISNLEWVEKDNLSGDQLSFIAYDIASRMKYLHPALKNLCPVLEVAICKIEGL